MDEFVLWSKSIRHNERNEYSTIWYHKIVGAIMKDYPGNFITIIIGSIVGHNKMTNEY